MCCIHLGNSITAFTCPASCLESEAAPPGFFKRLLLSYGELVNSVSDVDDATQFEVSRLSSIQSNAQNTR